MLMEENIIVDFFQINRFYYHRQPYLLNFVRHFANWARSKYERVVAVAKKNTSRAEWIQFTDEGIALAVDAFAVCTMH